MLTMPEYMKHLQPLAAQVEEQEDGARVTLRCPCGCGLFRVERTAFTPEEEEQIAAYIEDVLTRPVEDPRKYRYQVRKDENGKDCVMRKRLFGKWVPVDTDRINPPMYKDVTAVRVICRACGTQTLLYDNRLHGSWDEFGYREEAMAWAPHWEEVQVPERAESIYAEVIKEEPDRVFWEREQQPPATVREIALWGLSARGESDLLYRS